MSVCQSVYLSVCLSVSLPVMSVCLSENGNDVTLIPQILFDSKKTKYILLPASVLLSGF